MKVIIELEKKDSDKIIGSIIKSVQGESKVRISNFMKNVSASDFKFLLKRSLRASSDSFLQHYMQYYLEQRAPEIMKLLAKDIRKRRQNKELK